MKEPSNPWLFKGNPVTVIQPPYLGFVYCITEIESGMRYVGYKLAFTKKGKPTDWKSYCSSSAKLKGLEVNNPKKFTKEILYFGENKTDLRVMEIYLLLEAYINGDWDSLYNENVNIRLRIRKGKEFQWGGTA